MRTRPIALLKEHWPAVCAALVMAFLVAAPLIVFPFYAGERYAGINIAHFGSDEHIYLTRAKEALEGNNLGQPILSFNKNLPDPTFSSVEHVLMFPFRLFGLDQRVDVPTVMNVYDFLGVAILVLILYALSYALLPDRLLALSTALFVIGGYSIVYNKALFYNDFNIYLRSMFPWTSSIPFFLFCLFLYKAREREWGIYWALGAGVCYGLLFYDYFFAWTFASAFGISLFVLLLVYKQYHYALRIALAGATGLVIAIPFLVSFSHYYASDLGAQLSYFLLSVRGHAPVMSLIGTATAILFCMHWYFKGRDENDPFVLAAIAAGWIALNQQVLTGRFIQYGHYYWYFIVPFSIVIGIYMFGTLLPKRYRTYFSLLLIALVVVNTVGGQYRSFFTTSGEKMRDQDYAPLIEKLRILPKGSVFTAVDGSSYSMLVTIYTNDDLYYSGSAETYNIFPDYMKDVLLMHLYLNSHARKDPIAFLRADLARNHYGDEYANMYEDLEGYYSGTDYYSYNRALLSGTSTIAATRETFLSQLRARYKELFTAPNSARAHLIESGVRYILWDTRITPEWDLSVLAPLRTVATSSDLVLYELVEKP